MARVLEIESIVNFKFEKAWICLQDTALELYFESMCRSMQFRHVKTVKHNGIEALR